MKIMVGAIGNLTINIALTLLLLGSPLAFADGKAIYMKSCAICHASLPPKLSDKATWQPRLTVGIDVLVQSVIKGKGKMPPIGNGILPDEDVRAAVEYMIEQVK